MLTVNVIVLATVQNADLLIAKIKQFSVPILQHIINNKIDIDYKSCIQ